MKNRLLALLLTLCVLLTALPAAFAEEASEPAPHEHSFSEKETQPASCTEDGKIVYACSCGETKSEKLSAKGHSFGEWIVTAEPNCTATGSRQRVCASCGATEDETLSCTGHSYASSITVEPTCTAAGEETFVCGVCGDTYTQEVAALGHDWQKTGAVAPTCTEAGTDYFSCARCEAAKEEAVAALGHAWDEGVVTAEPTCTAAGSKLYTCTREGCGATRDEEIAALGHAWDEGVVTLEPSCTEAGSKLYSCTREGCGVTRDEEIAALGHAWNEGDIIKEATCAEAGEKLLSCTVCEATEIVAIEKLPHTLDEGVVTLEATCLEDGEMTYTCSVCGEVVTEVIPALGHDFVDLVCTRCGQVDETAVAMNGENYYDDLQKAFDAAADGETVVLLKSLELEKGVTVKSGITFDMDGKSLTGEDLGEKAAVLTVDAGGKDEVVLKDGRITAKGLMKYAVQNTKCDTLLLDDMTLDIRKIEDNEKNVYALSNNAGEITLTDGTALLADADYEETKQLAADIYNSGTQMILDEDFHGTVTGQIKLCAAWDYAESEDLSTRSYGKGEKLVIKVPLGVVNRGAEDDAYVVITQSLLGLVLRDEPAACVIHGDETTDYTTLNAALSAAVDGDTVKLLQDAYSEETAFSINNKSIELDLNGFTIECEFASALRFGQSATTNVVIKDSVGTGFVKAPEGSALQVRANGHVTVTGGKYSGSLSVSEGGSLTITGGSFKRDPNAYLAEGYYAVLESGYYVVYSSTNSEAKLVHSDGTETSYTTLDEAIAAATATDTVVLSKAIDSDIDISVSKALKLDFNGCGDPACTVSITGTNGTITLLDSGETKPALKLDLQSGSFKLGETGKGLVLAGNGFEFVSGGYLTPVSGELTNAEITVSSGTTTYMDFDDPVNFSGNATISSGTYGATIYVASGSLTITGGDFLRGSLVYPVSGSLSITGGYFGGDPYKLLNKSVYTAILITDESDSHVGYWKVDQISNYKLYRLVDEQGFNWTTVSGASGYKTVRAGLAADKTWGYQYDTTGAQNETDRPYYYKTLEEAIEAPEQKFSFAADNSADGIKYTVAASTPTDTLHLIANLDDVQNGVSIPHNMIIDLGGKSISYTPKLDSTNHEAGEQHFIDLFSLEDTSNYTFTVQNGSVDIGHVSSQSSDAFHGSNAGFLYVNTASNCYIKNVRITDHNGTGAAWSTDNKSYIITAMNGNAHIYLDGQTSLVGNTTVDPESMGTVHPSLGTFFSTLPQISKGEGHIDMHNGQWYFKSVDGYYVVTEGEAFAALVEKTVAGTSTSSSNVTTTYYATLQAAYEACTDTSATYVITVLGEDATQRYIGPEDYTLELKQNMTLLMSADYLDEETIYSVDGTIIELSAPGSQVPEANSNDTATGDESTLTVHKVKITHTQLSTGASPVRLALMRSAEPTDGRYTFTAEPCSHLYSDDYLIWKNGYCPNCGAKLWSLVELEARVNGGAVTDLTINSVGRNGWCEVGTSHTIQAPSRSDISFGGWYRKVGSSETRVTQSTSYNFTVGEDNLRFIASYTTTEKWCEIRVTATRPFYIYAQGTERPSAPTTSNTPVSFKYGTKIYVECEQDDDLFVAWTNQNKFLMSTDRQFAMTVVSNMDLYMQEKTEVGNVRSWVQFNTTDGQILECGQYTGDDIDSNKLQVPTPHARLGQKFDGWDLDGVTYRTNAELLTALAEKLRSIAQMGETVIITPHVIWDPNRNDYTVHWVCRDESGNVLSTTDKTGKVGEAIVIVADETMNGLSFDHYETESEGRMVVSCYNRQYNVKPKYGSDRSASSTNTLNVYAIYKAAPSARQAVVRASEMYATKVMNAKNDKIYRISYQFEFSMPEEFEMLERGVLYTSDSAYATETTLILENATDQSTGKKIGKGTFSVYDELRGGTMTANINGNSTESVRKVRGFLTYKDGNDIFTVYSEIIGESWASLNAVHPAEEINT